MWPSISKVSFMPTGIALFGPTNTTPTDRENIHTPGNNHLSECCIANLLHQWQHPTPEPGALHLTRPTDLLQLELSDPDLSLYQTPGGEPSRDEPGSTTQSEPIPVQCELFGGP